MIKVRKCLDGFNCLICKEVICTVPHYQRDTIVKFVHLVMHRLGHIHLHMNDPRLWKLKHVKIV